MRKGLIASTFVLIILIAFWISVPTGCANPLPPQGGPRDSIPPVLVSATPRDSSVNFKGDRIVLTFDEDLDDPRDMQNNLFFSPSFDVNPELAVKGRTLTIRFRDTLLANTTYVLNFGNAIVDVTEGNPVKDFVYTFSTGPKLDSLEIKGKVLLAETGEIDSTLSVVLYKDRSDSAVSRRRPLYVAKLDRNGYFRFRNLPRDTFAIYATGASKMFQSNQPFAFSNAPVVAGEADSLVLYAFKEATPAITASLPGGITRTPANDRRLRFTPSTTSQQELINDFTLNFPVPLKAFDSTKLHLASDSVFNPEKFTASIDTSKKEVRIKTPWKEGLSYHLILEKDFATDTAGRQLLKTDTISFAAKKKADYGSLALKVKGIAAFKNPVLQFVQNNQVVLSVSISSGVFNQALFQPGEYTIRIFDDLNNNGKWDTGKFSGEKRQPEIVHPVQRTFTIKPNWDNEFDVAL
jgi:hypothetical protein